MGMDFAGDCNPAQDRGRCARGTADDDVLRCRPFQPDRVDHGISDQGQEREHSGEGVDILGQDHHGHQTEAEGENHGLDLGQLAGGQGAAPGALHDGVYTGVQDVVDGRGGGGRHADAQGAQQEFVQGGHARDSQEHADDGREDDQTHDLQLAQLEVVRNSV